MDELKEKSSNPRPNMNEPMGAYSDNYTRAANLEKGPGIVEQMRQIWGARPRTDFPTALIELKRGKKITREIWAGYWVYLNDASIHSFNTFGQGAQTKLTKGIIIAHKADGSFAPAMPYQEDMLAEDWIVLE
jgi:hypothetical protein